jgi:hypothetical protein
MRPRGEPLRIVPNPPYVTTEVACEPFVTGDGASMREQDRLLLTLRSSRLLEAFTGARCVHLRSRVRTDVPGLGQVSHRRGLPGHQGRRGV